MSKSLKIILVAFIGAIVIVTLAYGGIFGKKGDGLGQKNIKQNKTAAEVKNTNLQSSTDYFSDWVVYENQKYRYRIQHPADLKPDGNEEKMSFDDPRWQTYSIVITVQPDQGLELAEWIKTKSVFKENILSRASNKTVGGYFATEICDFTNPNLNYCAVFIKRGDLIFWIDFAFYTKDVETSSRFYREAISSFSFF